jgi:mannose-6-phosphate isomerase-like protein (cupin superfamily)
MPSKTFLSVAMMAVLSVGGLCAFAGAADPQAAEPKPNPTCKMCPGTYIPVSELNAYTEQAVAHHIVDQQVRSVDIGKVNIGIGMVTRGKLVPGQGGAESVAEHDQVSEVYHVIEGSATLLTGPDLVDPKKRPDTMLTVREQNGPGFSSRAINNPETHELHAGDVIIIPAGTGHWFTKIDDHITYLMVRIDPDKILPLKSEQQSKDHLAHPYDPSKGNF